MLLLVALVVAGVLFITLNRGDAADDLPTDTIVPGTALPSGSAAPGVVAAGPVAIASVQAWDPDGDNGAENDSQAGNAIADGSPSTSWPTECYSNQYLGGKRGVGLILRLTAPSTGTLSVDSINGPYQLEIYATTDAAAPTDLAGWTQVGETFFDDQPGTVTATVDIPATFVLVWLKELGHDEACTENNPFRGRLGEISYTP